MQPLARCDELREREDRLLPNVAPTDDLRAAAFPSAIGDWSATTGYRCGRSLPIGQERLPRMQAVLSCELTA